MARKQRNTADYFPHEAAPNQTIFILEAKWGNDGYAFWFKLQSLLCQAEGHYLNCSQIQSWEYLLAITRVNAITGSEMMAMLSNLGDIDSELWYSHKIIWCPRLVEDLKDVYSRRGRPLPLKPFPNSLPQVLTTDGISEPEIQQSQIPAPKSTQSKVEESKVEESKVEESKVEGPPTTFDTYKEKIRSKLPEFDIEEEWERCQIWFRDNKKEIKSPSLALSNWMRKAVEIKVKGGKDGKQTKLLPRAQRLRGPIKYIRESPPDSEEGKEGVP